MPSGLRVVRDIVSYPLWALFLDLLGSGKGRASSAVSVGSGVSFDGY